MAEREQRNTSTRSDEQRNEQRNEQHARQQQTQDESRELSHRGDREQELRTSREPDSQARHAGMQRTGSRGSIRGSERERGRTQLLPAFMANPGLMASAFLSNPFAFAEAMSDEMDRLFATSGAGWERGPSDQFARGERQGMTRRGADSAWAPTMEVRQRENELVVCADLPGVSPDDVHVDIEDNVLTVSGERARSQESDQDGYYRSERSYGAFSRSIALPDGIDEDQVDARFENGVLEITVPLPERAPQRRRVDIRTGVGSSRSASSASGSDAR